MDIKFDDFIDTLDIPGMEEFIGLVKTPDNIFNMLYPSLKQELSKVIHDPQTENMIKETTNTPEYKEISEQIPMIIADLHSLKDANPNKIEFITMILEIFTGDFSDAEVLVEFIHKDEKSKLPAYAHLTDAGADIYVNNDLVVGPGEFGVIVPTGMKMAIPVGWQLAVRPRSGLSHKTLIRVANAPGTIDAGYRDEVGIIIDNFDDGPFTVANGDRLAQLVLEKVYKAKYTEVPSVANIGEDRGGGYGSSGD